MTTMFVQLRRVVYLLVFLTCISALVLAQGEKGVVTEVAKNDVEAAVIDQEKAWGTYLDIPNFTKDELGKNDILGETGNADLRDIVWRTLVIVRDSEIHFKNGTACASEWKKVVEANEKTVRDAEEATEKIKGLINRIDEVADPETKDKYGKKTPMKLKDACDAEKFAKLIQDIQEILGETKEKAPGKEVVFKIAEAKQAELLCKSKRSDVDHILRDLERKVEGITSYVGDYNRSDNAMLVKRVAEGINATLRNVTALIDNVTVQDRFAVGRIKTLVQEWKEAYAELERLADLRSAWTSDTSNQKCKIGEKQSQLEAISGLIKEPLEEIKNATDTVGAVDERAKETRKEYARLVIRNVTEAIKNVTTGMEEKKKEVARERARREEEARRAAEKARRKREEEERARQAAERVREEQARQAAEKAKEEQARQAAEKARLAAEQKAREKEARRAAEKAKQEEAEKAKKKKDDSSSPALVHSSLILLVLCVLGYTLVC
ncbi:uncharacterized protein TM35_000041030 [Trypanosoma theileri]|uniref:Uncharacterized protein n=1 Tax=Trypanosoma theileri TaxID=67003 RepID=A0A1X0P5Q7_9TRYP|nr:uncharacterized protein TM35_000041030 [Trypanosoma theileri]ORC91889.1 hypothetical protein TM35_000041030 [Trypanosoma theileri]